MPINRRHFITASVAAGIAYQTRLQQAAASVKANGTQIGLILYTIRDLLKTEETIRKTMNQVREIGYQAVEITSVGSMPVPDFAKLLKSLDMKAVSAHQGWDTLKNNLDKVIEDHKTMGCPHVVSPVTPNEYRNKDGYAQFAKEASEIAHKLKEHGITYGYHNHSFEFVRYGDKTGQDILFENGDPQVFNLEIDTYWVQDGGANPAAWIRKAINRVPTVHMKDMIVHDGGRMFAPVGEGNLDWVSILEANNVAGVDYYIVEQDRHLGDPMENIATSYKNMKSWGLV